MEFQALFQPLATNDYFSILRHHTNPPPRKQMAWTPLDIPKDRSQCVHITSEELSEGMNYNRCLQTAIPGRNGYLCPDHDRILNPPMRKVRGSIFVDDVETLKVKMQREVHGATEVGLHYKSYASKGWASKPLAPMLSDEYEIVDEEDCYDPWR